MNAVKEITSCVITSRVTASRQLSPKWPADLGSESDSFGDIHLTRLILTKLENGSMVFKIRKYSPFFPNKQGL